MTPDDAPPDRWALMTLQLAGEPLPEPPALPGRRCGGMPPFDPSGRDALAEAHDAAEVKLQPGWWGLGHENPSGSSGITPHTGTLRPVIALVPGYE